MTNVDNYHGIDKPGNLAFDSSGNLWVADPVEHRILEFKPPFSKLQDASLVLGQPDFTILSDNTGGLSTTSLWEPEGLAFDSSGNLWVADAENNRVLEYQFPFSNHESADIVLGQQDFTNSIGNDVGSGIPPQSASSLRHPTGLTFDSSGNLWVADSENHRILEFTSTNGHFLNGQAAFLVIGQPDFTHIDSKNGQISTSEKAFDTPTHLAFDSSGNLWVADTNDDRILEFKSPFSNYEAASFVLGQEDFTSNGLIPGSPLGISASSLNHPKGLAFDSSGNLWVADDQNNRVLEFSLATSSSSASQNSTMQSMGIPVWIKKTAKWWSEGSISDDDFIKGIQYLVQQGILKLPATQASSNPSQVIPSWVKNNTKWWYEGQIGDSDFVKGIQYLVENGIIKINSK